MSILPKHIHIKYFFIAATVSTIFFFVLFFSFSRIGKAEACPADNPNCNSLECTSYPCTPPGNPPPASLEGCTTQTILGIGTFSTCPQTETVGGYLQKMYAFLLAFVAIAAFGGITYGGLLYVFSAGNISSTDEAKKWIWNALIGLFITAISFILLRAINPDLITNFNLDLKKYLPQSSGTTGLPLDSSCDPNNDQCASGSACIPSVGGGGVCRPNANTRV